MTVTTEALRGAITIESFYRKCPDGRQVSFSTFDDAGLLQKQLHKDHHVCGSSDARPAVVLTNPDGDAPGEHMGTVAVHADDHFLETINRAIRALEAVRDGLLEAGHSD